MNNDAKNHVFQWYGWNPPPFLITIELPKKKVRGVHKTEEPIKPNETDRTVSKISVRFQFLFLTNRNFDFGFGFGFRYVCTELNNIY